MGLINKLKKFKNNTLTFKDPDTKLIFHNRSWRINNKCNKISTSEFGNFNFDTLKEKTAGVNKEKYKLSQFGHIGVIYGKKSF